LNSSPVRRFAHAISWTSVVVTALFIVILGIQGISIVSGVPTYFSLFIGIAAATTMLVCAALLTIVTRRKPRIVVRLQPATFRVEGSLGPLDQSARYFAEALPNVPNTESAIIELASRQLSSIGFIVESQRPLGEKHRAMFDLIAAKGDLTLAIEAKTRRGVAHDVVAIGQMASEIQAGGGKTVVPILICKGFTASAKRAARERGVRLRSTLGFWLDPSLDLA